MTFAKTPWVPFVLLSMNRRMSSSFGWGFLFFAFVFVLWGFFVLFFGFFFFLGGGGGGGVADCELFFHQLAIFFDLLQ